MSVTLLLINHGAASMMNGLISSHLPRGVLQRYGEIESKDPLIDLRDVDDSKTIDFF